MIDVATNAVGTQARARTMEHQFGQHIENSRFEETFKRELRMLEKTLCQWVTTFSKHGFGLLRLGFHHYPPYEPERCFPWAKNVGLKYFLGNLENPELESQRNGEVLNSPGAFWLEPTWRDVSRYPIEWLLREATKRDVVMLMHPDNVTASEAISREFLLAIDHLETVILPS